jgi:hypothetical protein
MAAGTQHGQRPRIAPALGLRAGGDAAPCIAGRSLKEERHGFLHQVVVPTGR